MSAQERFQNSLIGLLEALRANEAAIDFNCEALRGALAGSTAKKVCLPAWVCLQPLSQVMQVALEGNGLGNRIKGETAPRVASFNALRVISALATLEAALDNASLSVAQLRLSDKTLAKSISDVFVQILMVLDLLQTRSGPEKADDEEVITRCYKSFYALLGIFSSSLLPKEHETPSVLKGPFLAQLVQSMLHFSAHRAKAVSVNSLSCLYRLLSVELLSDPGIWRPYFPGIFSGLYGISTSDYKRYIQCLVDGVFIMTLPFSY